MTPKALAEIQAIEDYLFTLPEVHIQVTHTLHAGIYARTVHIPAGTATVGAFVKIPTVLTVSGDGALFVGDGCFEVEGFTILEGQAGRKQAFTAYTDCDVTMAFATNAQTAEEAEREFTDDFERLQNRRIAA